MVKRFFEGMKAYKDENNDVWLFRPDQNYNRFNTSAVEWLCLKFQKNYT
jgi:branched-subunit amino acid aminotransferase/4-amino-4-deoxychorismate lyase